VPTAESAVPLGGVVLQEMDVEMAPPMLVEGGRVRRVREKKPPREASRRKLFSCPKRMLEQRGRPGAKKRHSSKRHSQTCPAV
jgi:hypothetical protein